MNKLKKIFKNIFTFTIFTFSISNFAAVCPTKDQVHALRFKSATKIRYSSLWAFQTERFIHEGKYWVTLYQISLPGDIQDDERALVIGQSSFDKLTFVDPWINKSSEEHFTCEYVPAGGVVMSWISHHQIY